MVGKKRMIPLFLCLSQRWKRSVNRTEDSLQRNGPAGFRKSHFLKIKEVKELPKWSAPSPPLGDEHFQPYKHWKDQWHQSSQFLITWRYFVISAFCSKCDIPHHPLGSWELCLTCASVVIPQERGPGRVPCVMLWNSPRGGATQTTSPTNICTSAAPHKPPAPEIFLPCLRIALEIQRGSFSKFLCNPNAHELKHIPQRPPWCSVELSLQAPLTALSPRWISGTF